MSGVRVSRHYARAESYSSRRGWCKRSTVVPSAIGVAAETVGFALAVRGCRWYGRSAWARSLSTGSPAGVVLGWSCSQGHAQCTVRPPQIGEGESRRRAASASGAVVIEAAEKANSGSCGSIHASGSRGAYPVTDSPNPQITPGGSNTGLGSYWPQ